MMKDWAKFYHTKGLAPMPLKGKIPLLDSWKGIKPTAADVQTWWTKWPDANIGLLCGPGRHLGLDIDGEEGKNSVHGRQLPATWTARSQKGKHYYFTWPSELAGSGNSVRILPGVDTRGENGFLVGAPSVCSDGSRYSWLPGLSPMDVPLASAPAWLVSELIKPVEQIKAGVQENWLEQILDGVGEGERHAAMVRLAGYYFDVMPADVAIKHLRDWNEKNTPPIDGLEFEDQLRDLAKRYGHEGEIQPAQALQMMSADQVAQSSSADIAWLVEGLIPKATTTIFSGWQGRGKSWLALDLATEIARGGGMWLNHLKVAGGPVLYVDNELHSSFISRRLFLMCRGKQMKMPHDLHFIIRQRVKLTDEKSRALLKQHLAALKPALVIVDSFASCHTLDENSSKDVRYFYDSLILPLVEEFKCSFMFIDHEGKGQPGIVWGGAKRLRGSGAKGDAADVVISLDEKDGMLVLEHSKARFSRKMQPAIVSIDDVNGGVVPRVLGYL